MKQTLTLALTLALLSSGAALEAQTTGAPAASSKPAPKQQMPRMGKIYGKLVDSKSKAVSDAYVALMQTKGGKKELVQATVSAGNGEFSLESLPMMGQFELVISANGYKDRRQPVAFDMNAMMKARNSGGGYSDPAMLNALNKDMGNIRLEEGAKSLEGVTVTASVPAYSLQGEKKIFDAQKNLTSQGGTAIDVMKNVPGVMIDADNKVTLRNSAPQILVDGRQTLLQLDQIPADAIRSIEVITNPSAKYDAEGGSGGVLNIVLKKNRQQGYNGMLRTSVDSRGGGALGGDFNVRRGKFNLAFSGQSNRSRSLGMATTERTDYYSNPDIHSLQNEENRSGGLFGMGWLGLDYFASNRTTISVGGMRMHAESTPDVNINMSIDSLFSTGTKNVWANRTTDGKNSFDMYSGQLNIKHLFVRPGREWTLDATYNSGASTYDSRYVTTPYQTPGHETPGTMAQQQTTGTGANKLLQVQSDFSNPLSEKSKIDVGVKATLRQVESNINNSYYDPSSEQFVQMVNPYSDYKTHDEVYAAYASYSGNFDDNSSIQIGLRAESSKYTGTLNKLDSSFTIQYPVSLFPSVFYTHKMKKDQQLQFAYRRGIARPNFFQLLPYTDYSDPLNIRQGNPALRPEFTNSVELSYEKNFSRSNYVMISLYDRYTENLITTYQSVSTNPFTGEDAIITSYINANSSNKFGVELTSGWDLKKWWNVTANANIYNAQLTAGEGSKTNSYPSGFGKLNNQFRFGKGWSAQLSGVYQSRTNLLPDLKNPGYGGMGGRGSMGPQASANAQGYLDAQWYVDAAIKKSFLKNDAASISLAVNDIFGTRKYIQHTENEYFVQDYSRLVNPTLFRLSFNWRFGKMDMDAMRRKNMKGQMEGMQDASQNMGM
jgi:outer membrane receptor protein involved in Fe transport